MKKITKKEFNKVVKLHQEWLISDGKKGKRADLSGVDFSGWEINNVNLNRAVMTDTNFSGCIIEHCSFVYALLKNADFENARIGSLMFNGAVMNGASFKHAHISDSTFTSARLIGSVFYHSNIMLCNMAGANLHNSSFIHTHLNAVNLTYVNLDYSHLICVTGLPELVCPEKGSFIGFKQAHYNPNKYTCIVELEILEDAMRSSATSRKCRCSKAKVLSISTLDGELLDCTAYSDHDSDFEYKVGEIVEVDNFDTNRWNECAPGIHFFITRQEAVDY